MKSTIVIVLAVSLLAGCGHGARQGHSMTVTATAYTTSASETSKGHTGLTAWGDHLKPGMKAIAVSRDLIPRGLHHGTRVSIDGLPGVYVVRDKMNKRWKRKIDIFMGHDVAAARKWGKQKVRIHWKQPSRTKK